MELIRSLSATLGTLTIAAAIASAPGAAAAEDFYKGKTVTIVVGFSPGGGYDTYARTLARHIGDHIAGNPTVIVQNMPGAGSLTAVRYLDATAPKDGTVITTFNPGQITESLTDPGKVKLKFSEYAFVGSITRDFRVCYAWGATGIKNWDDLAKANEFVLGATAPGVGAYVNGAVLRNVFGFKIRQVVGYPGSAEQRLAIERGELHGDCGSWSSIPPEWIAENKINPLVRFSPVSTPDMPKNIPFAGDLAKTDEQKRILKIVGAPGELGRPFIMSKQVPQDRLEIIRAAFDATMRDKEFLSDAEKQRLPVYPADGKEAAEIISEIYASPPELVEKAKNAVK
jgi:tripartite-type tricarboxylate transporter receptor subunit TctC